MTELERFADAVPSMQIIREFMAWCEEQKIELAVPTPSGKWLQPHVEGLEHMMARYFGIDFVKLENERRALLEKHSAFNSPPSTIKRRLNEAWRVLARKRDGNTPRR